MSFNEGILIFCFAQSWVGLATSRQPYWPYHTNTLFYLNEHVRHSVKTAKIYYNDAEDRGSAECSSNQAIGAVQVFGECKEKNLYFLVLFVFFVFKLKTSVQNLIQDIMQKPKITIFFSFLIIKLFSLNHFLVLDPNFSHFCLSETVIEPEVFKNYFQGSPTQEARKVQAALADGSQALRSRAHSLVREYLVIHIVLANATRPAGITNLTRRD